MRTFVLIIVLTFGLSPSAQSKLTLEGKVFVTRAEYHALGKPCACPDDQARNGRCGRRAAVCKHGGYNILDCTQDKVQSLKDYNHIVRKICKI